MKGIVSTDSDFLNNFGLGKKEYFWVRKISNIPTNLPNKKTICYEGDIPKNKKTIRQNSPKSTTALPTPKSPLITNPTSEKTIVLPITESTFQQEKLLETPHETLKDTLKLKEVVARKNLLISKIIVTDPTIELKLYDNGIVDNDSVTILYNGNIIATHQKLSEIPVTINLTLDKEKSKHEIILFAENLGTMPPNTALIIINTNGKRYELRSSANMEENAVLYFDYKPK